MARNLNDLNDVLFAQLDKISNNDLQGDDLEQELTRTEAVIKLGTTIIQNANVVLQAYKFKDNALDADMQLPRIIGQ